MGPPNKTVESLILQPIRSGVRLVSALVIVTVTILTVSSTNQVSRGIEELLVSYAQSTASASLANQDVLNIQRELSPLSRSIETAFGVETDINLYVDGRLVGQLPGGLGRRLFTSRIDKEFREGSGKFVRFEIVIDYSSRLMRMAALVIFLQSVIFGAFYLWKTIMLRAVQSVTVPLNTTVSWTESLVERLQDEAATVGDLPGSDIKEISRLTGSMLSMAGRVRSLQEKIRQTEFDRGRFELSAQVAHDIRAPLSALKVGLLAMKNGDVVSSHDMIDMAAKRMEQLAAELLDVRRGLRSDTESPTEVGQVLGVVSFELRARASAKNVTINLQTEAVKTSMGSAQLLRVLSNLTTNALECLPEYGGVIDIHCSAKGKTVCIEISDNGPGLPNRIRSNPWGGLTVGKAGGNGMGLRYAWEQTRACGGELSFETSDRGTRFVLLLPRVDRYN